MQAVFAVVLYQGAAGAVDDALGHARGARRIHDKQRVVERQLREVDVANRLIPEIVGEVNGVFQAGYVRVPGRVGHHHHPADAR